MKVKIRCFSGLLCVIFVFCSIFSITNSFAVVANAQINDNNCTPKYSESLNTTTCCREGDDKYILLESEKVHFLQNENIRVTYSVSNEEGIVSISHSENGFNVIAINIDEEENYKVTVELSCLSSSLEYTLSLQLELESGNNVKASLYAINNEYGVFVSPFSEDDARERYFDYAIEESILTPEECEEIRAEFGRRCVIEEISINNLSTIPNGGITTMVDTNTQEIYIEGLLRWRDDDNNIHPLRSVMVEIYRTDAISTTQLGTVYTDNDGNFSYTFINSNGMWGSENTLHNIFIRVYAGNPNAMVEIGDSGNKYYYESRVYEHTTSGDTVTTDSLFIMSNDLGKAFQISQAIITARDYAWAMMGEMPSDVTIRYPKGEGCAYNIASSYIRVTGNPRYDQTVPHSYASWDVLMHEYGHHIQYIVDNTANPGLSHSSSNNNADVHKNKDIGIRLAWGESWPTVFGLMAQQYYSDYLTNIATTRDTFYTSYNSLNYDIENNTDSRLGEACERSIMSVLWDLFDSNNDNLDTISLGHSAFWNITTIDGCYTFSDFIGCFYEQYPSYIDDIGLNLSYYKMATTKPYISNSSSVSQTEPPTFNWTAQGGSTRYPNNSFVLIFYNSLGEEILRTAPTTSINYTLTQSEWLSVLYSYGKTYTVAVAATQTNSPTTGEYISAKSVSYTKPIAANLSQSLNISAYEIYTERVANLQPRQYIMYTITFATGGNNLIQTFGSKDAKIYLYDNNGNLVDKDDDLGYTQNAFLNYTVTAGVSYTLKVQFYDNSEFGEIKVGITPASSIYSEYEDILTATGTSAYFQFSTALNSTKVLTFTPTESGEYEFTTNYVQEPRIDTFLYLIDPVSTDACLFDDDYAGNLQALISTELVEGRTYFIVVSTYNITNTSGLLSLTIVKAQ